VSAVLSPPRPANTVALPQPKSCRNCRRSQYHVSADTLRCTERKGAAADGVIWIGVAQVKTAAAQREYDHAARVIAERCRFYQEER
jgi:hypothetical protein